MLALLVELRKPQLGTHLASSASSSCRPVVFDTRHSRTLRTLLPRNSSIVRNRFPSFLARLRSQRIGLFDRMAAVSAGLLPSSPPLSTYRNAPGGPRPRSRQVQTRARGGSFSPDALAMRKPSSIPSMPCPGRDRAWPFLHRSPGLGWLVIHPVCATVHLAIYDR